jgi:hypothetical protein
VEESGSPPLTKLASTFMALVLIRHGSTTTARANQICRGYFIEAIRHHTQTNGHSDTQSNRLKMVDTPKAASQSPISSSLGKPHSAGLRHRVISSCLTCRRRKVKCDHVHPVCGACSRGNHACAYATDQGLSGLTQATSSRVSKVFNPTTTTKSGRGGDVQARLDRLELLLEQAVSGQHLPSRERHQRRLEHERQDTNHHVAPSSDSQGSQNAGISSDNHDGTLILEEGQSQFVSSLHYALMAEEVCVRDIPLLQHRIIAVIR